MHFNTRHITPAKGLLTASRTQQPNTLTSHHNACDGTAAEAPRPAAPAAAASS